AVPSPLLTAAARRAAAAWALANDGGEATAAAAADVLGALASSVYRRQSDPDAPLDPRAYAPFAPRLLALLRAEVIAAWPTGDPRRAEEVRAILTAIEGVCAAVERDPGGDFAVQFAGPQALDMLVAVAHDLRSPLTSILFLADTLERGQSGPVTEVQRRQLALIYGAALGLCAATSDIVELARGGNGLVEQEPVPFAVSAVLDSVRDIVRPIAAEKGLEVRLAAPTRDQLGGQAVGQHHVVDVGEVPGLQPVAVHFQALVAHGGGDEAGDDRRVLRGRVLPRAEHVEVAQRHGRQPVEGGEDPAVVLGGQLGDGVRGDGRRRLVLPQGQGGRRPV